MKVAVFIADSNGGYPVPASKGGAVSTIVEQLVKMNNNKQLLELEIISLYDCKAEELSKQYPNVSFIWVRIPVIMKWMDGFIYHIIRMLFKKKKAISFKSLFSLFYYIIKGRRILQKNSYDKVVLENNVPLAWIIKLSHFKGDYYYHFHNVPRINAGCQKVFEHCTSILCVSHFVKKELSNPQNAIGPISEQKMQVLYNCIDTTLFQNRNYSNLEKSQIRKKYDFSLEDKIIVFVGRLSKEKGVDIILDALALIKDKSIKLLIVGSLVHGDREKDPYQMKLNERASKLADRVKFSGYIEQSVLPEIYNMADIAVLPSMWDEPAGLTMIEAMACGLPVITTASGGIPEYVGECGIVLNKNKELINNLNIVINGLLMNDNKRKEMASIGTAHIKTNFSSENYLLNFIECIR